MKFINNRFLIMNNATIEVCRNKITYFNKKINIEPLYNYLIRTFYNNLSFNLYINSFKKSVLKGV